MENDIQEEYTNIFKKLLKNVEWSSIPKVALIFIIISLFLTVSGIILIIIDIIRLIAYSSKKGNIDNPLIVDTLEYNVIYSTRFFKFTKFNMWLYLLIPFTSLIFIGLTLSKIGGNKSDDSKSLTNAYKLLIFVGVYNLLVFIVYLGVFLSANKKFKYIKERLNKANTFICNNIYKNPIFLKQLTLKEDTYQLDEIIKTTLQDIPIDIKKDDLTKLYYTLHLYSHLHKIGIYDVRTKEAINEFKPLNIISGCSFIQYFYRYGTFIENINNILSQYTPNNIPNNVVRSALTKCYSSISQTNTLANSIRIEYALSPFNTLFIVNSIIQIVPLLILYIFTKSKKLQEVGKSFIARTLDKFKKQKDTSYSSAETEEVAPEEEKAVAQEEEKAVAPEEEKAVAPEEEGETASAEEEAGETTSEEEASAPVEEEQVVAPAPALTEKETVAAPLVDSSGKPLKPIKKIFGKNITPEQQAEAIKNIDEALERVTKAREAFEKASKNTKGGSIKQTGGNEQENRKQIIENYKNSLTSLKTILKYNRKYITRETAKKYENILKEKQSNFDRVTTSREGKQYLASSGLGMDFLSGVASISGWLTFIDMFSG